MASRVAAIAAGVGAGQSNQGFSMQALADSAQNQGLTSGGVLGGQSAVQFVANQVAQNNAANAAQNIAQAQLASQGISSLSGPASQIMSGINPAQGATSTVVNRANIGMEGFNPVASASASDALEAGGNPYADDPANTLTAGMAVGEAPIATAGNFNPKVEFAASRMFGPQKFTKKPLITF